MSTLAFGASIWILPSSKRWFGTNAKTTHYAHLLNQEGSPLCLRLHHRHGTLLLAGIYSPRAISSTVVTAQKKEAHFVASEDDSEDDEYVPFTEMRHWKANSPPGFGHGKTYDTSLEDSLVTEIEQAQKAHAANVNKLKTRNKVVDGKHEKRHEGQRQQTVLESVPSGVNVRLENLPKKKNIVRDLQAAFKGFPGLLHISPVVSGNKKTRDPICKGLAFLVFKSEDIANRFAMRYNGESILFGKVERKITCSLACPNSLTNFNSMSPVAMTMHRMPRLKIREKEAHLVDHVLDSPVSQQEEKENYPKPSMGSGDNDSANVNVTEEKSAEKRPGYLAKHGCGSSSKSEEQDPLDARSALREPEKNLPMTSLNNQAHIMTVGSEVYKHTVMNENDNQDHKNDVQVGSNSAVNILADLSSRMVEKKNLLFVETKSAHVSGVSFSEDLEKEGEYSEDCSKVSEDALDKNAGRGLKNSSSRNGELRELGALESRVGEHEHRQQGASMVKKLQGQALALEAENPKSKKERMAFTVLASTVNEQKQKKWKDQKHHRSKKKTELKSSKPITGVIGSAYRLKKKERGVLTDVLAKYGGDRAVINTP